MKNQFILWTASLFIIFLIGYIKAVTSINYPLTGTFGIEGKSTGSFGKVSYKLDKVCYDQTSYKNIVISDLSGLSGKIILLNYNRQSEIMMTEIDRGLKAEIPSLKPGTQLSYKILLSYKGKTYNIPNKGFVKLTFRGNIPSAVFSLYFFIIYCGLLLTIRSAMELFNKNKLLKKFAFVTTAIFILNTILISPLYNSYKFGAINKYVPLFTDLFEPALIIISIVWIIGTILLFFNKFVSITTIAVVLATIVLFFLMPGI